MRDFTAKIDGCTLEYIDDGHIYLVDGVIVPSITEILRCKFGHKYDYVDRRTLERASAKGTEVHDAIQTYVETGEVIDLPEVRNFRFLQRQYGFDVLECETPVILWLDDVPVCAGRCDLVLDMDGEIGGADIKRTASLDRMYLAYQLNLYRIAYRQSYGIDWTFLRGVHLRDDRRRFVKIPIAEEYAIDLIEEWRKENEGQ